MIATTMTTDSASVSSTSWIEPSMKTASSPVMKMLTPVGQRPGSSATIARMLREISSVLLSAWRITPIPSPLWPFERRIELPLSGPSVTVATSASRVVSSSISAPKASGVLTVAVVRTTRLWFEAVSDPAGLSKATVASASRTSASGQPAARQRRLVHVHPEDALAAAEDLQVGHPRRRDQPVRDACSRRGRSDPRPTSCPRSRRCGSPRRSWRRP